MCLFFPGGDTETLVRTKRDTLSKDKHKIDRLNLKFTVEQVAQKVYSTHNTTKHKGDQIVIDATTLELGIRLCPERSKRVFQHHHLSFVLYQLTDNGEGIAMDSYHSHHDDIIEDSSEERGETGCYLYWVNFDVTNTIQSWLVQEKTNHGIRVECKGC